MSLFTLLCHGMSGCSGSDFAELSDASSSSAEHGSTASDEDVSDSQDSSSASQNSDGLFDDPVPGSACASARHPEFGEHRLAAREFDMGPCGDIVFLDDDGSVRLLSPGREADHLDASTWLRSNQFSRDGRWLLTGPHADGPGPLVLHDLREGTSEVLARLSEDGHFGKRGLVPAPHAETWPWACFADGVSVWRGGTRSSFDELPPVNCASVRVSSGGPWLVVADHDASIWWIDAIAGEVHEVGQGFDRPESSSPLGRADQLFVDHDGRWFMHMRRSYDEDDSETLPLSSTVTWLAGEDPPSPQTWDGVSRIHQPAFRGAFALVGSTRSSRDVLIGARGAYEGSTTTQWTLDPLGRAYGRERDAGDAALWNWARGDAEPRRVASVAGDATIVAAIPEGPLLIGLDGGTRVRALDPSSSTLSDELAFEDSPGFVWAKDRMFATVSGGLSLYDAQLRMVASHPFPAAVIAERPDGWLLQARESNATGSDRLSLGLLRVGEEHMQELWSRAGDVVGASVRVDARANHVALLWREPDGGDTWLEYGSI